MFYEMKHAKKLKFFSLFLQKNKTIFDYKNLLFFSENCWHSLERNIGVKYIGECKITFLDLTCLPNFQQLNWEQSTDPKIHHEIIVLFPSSIRKIWNRKKSVKKQHPLAKKKSLKVHL